MKFQPDDAAGLNAINRHEPGRVWVNGALFETSLVVPWQGEVLPWDAGTAAELTPAHFERLLAFKPEVVIFGSGRSLRFVSPSLMRALIEARIGVETMDTAAACRTYNVLVSERRNALACLLLGAA